MRPALAQTYATLPFTVASGSGMYVFDTDGNRYLDLYGGHAVAVLGHSPPDVARAIAEQAEKLLFYSNVAPLEVRDRAAERLLRFAGGHFEQVFFCNSGAEANENALKLAIQKTGRSKLVALRGSFHGRTLLASAVTDNAKWHSHTPGWMGPVSFLAPNDLDALSAVDSETAAVVVEPIQSMAGVVTLTASYLSSLRARCDEVGAMLVFDEVQTGMGRTGTSFVSGSCGVTPDMATSAKGLAGGVPMGALLLSPKVAALVGDGDLGSTFGGGPLACAALLATVETIERDGLCASALRFEAAVRAIPGVEEVLGRGCLLGLRLTKPAKDVHKALLASHIITGTSHDLSVLRLLPPLIAAPEHAEALGKALSDMP